MTKFDAGGGGVLVTWGGPGSGPGLFEGPTGIDVDASCNVLVADPGNLRVQKFSYPTGCN